MWDLEGEWNGGVAPSITYSTPPEGVILMQFTGLKDKNGKEIYEGDIVRNHNEALTIDMVTGVVWDFRQLAMLEDQREEWEIIGNIYENPELLTKV